MKKNKFLQELKESSQSLKHYRVSGTLTLNWSILIQAKNPRQAEIEAIEYVEDGLYEEGNPVEAPEITSVTLVKPINPTLKKKSS